MRPREEGKKRRPFYLYTGRGEGRERGKEGLPLSGGEEGGEETQLPG